MLDQQDHPQPVSTQSVEDRARQRLRQARLQQGWSLATLASRSGIGASTISRLETGGRRLALDQLAPLATALGIGLDELIAPDPDEDVVLRPLPRKVAGMTMWPLTRSRRAGQPAVLKLAVPARRRPAPVAHPGQEWLYVLDGTLRLILGERELLLRPGQTAEFSTTTPHWLGGHGGTVELLVIFDDHATDVHLSPTT